VEGYMKWDSPFYKPQNKICEEAWDEFLHAAKMLLILDYHKSKEDKAKPDYREPDIYAVFNKLRQDIHNELPYSKSFIEGIDRSIEREFKREERERIASRPIGYVPSGDRGITERY
jgi:hypothetical protein